MSYTPQGFIDVEGFEGAIKERDWRNIIKHGSALNSFAKAKAYLNPTVGLVEWQLGLYQKNRSIKKVIVFYNSYVYLPLGLLRFDKYIISLHHEMTILASI